MLLLDTHVLASFALSKAIAPSMISPTAGPHLPLP